MPFLQHIKLKIKFKNPVNSDYYSIKYWWEINIKRNALPIALSEAVNRFFTIFVRAVNKKHYLGEKKSKYR